MSIKSKYVVPDQPEGARDRFMTTYSGLRYYFARPTVDMVSLEDIAHHLANINRFNGALDQPISVAQHSLLVEYLAPVELKPWALMHDAHEAYVGDVSSPLKALLGRTFEHYDELARSVVAEKFGLPWGESHDKRISEYDWQALKIEAERLADLDWLDRGEIPPPAVDVPSFLTNPCTWQGAKTLFLNRAKELFEVQYYGPSAGKTATPRAV